MTFGDMAVYSDTLYWSGISLNHDLVIELDPITDCDLIIKFRAVSKDYYLTSAASQQRTLNPSFCPIFGLELVLMLRRFFSEVAMSPDFEYQTFIGTIFPLDHDIDSILSQW